MATKKLAAIGQLKSAIILWFNEADPISLLVLATHSSDCIHAIGKKRGKPSPLQLGLESRSQLIRDRARYVADFAKHGDMDMEDRVEFAPRFSGYLMIDAVACYEAIYGVKTPLMTLFAARYFSEYPQGAKAEFQILVQCGAVNNLGNGSRKEFLESHPAWMRLPTSPDAHLEFPY